MNDKLREEIDSRYTKPIQGSSVEVVTDDSPERNQEVVQRSMPYSMETPEEFKDRIDKEKE